jgi:4'-phosphopantetheinyl transferase EntD
MQVTGTGLMSQLGELLPSTVRCVFSEHPPENLDLPAAEKEAAHTMRPSRLSEFAHGRACARRALARLGIPACPIPVGVNREPLWPEDVVGSISHCGQHAAAAVAYRTNTEGLGIDLETTERLDGPLLNIVCRPEELLWLERAESNGFLDKLFFSAKESLFKCVWPTVRRFIDFHEIEIGLNLTNGTFTAVSHHEELSDPLISRLRGNFRQSDKLIITTAYLA